MLIFVFYLLFSLANAVETSLNLSYIQVEGVDAGNGVSYWLGLPFASPPLGNLRWRAPVDPAVQDTPIDASSHKPICLGQGTTYNSANPPSGESEDCLYVDVYAPTNATAESKLPVYLWLQGGGFATNASPNYNGTSLIQASGQEIVVVTFNYRVGVYGFMASKEVQEDGNVNGGLLDQRKAMEWVQKYIAAFGGDPGHVTIGGASAGGASVNLHLTAYSGRDDGLFHAAAGESPSYGAQQTIEGSQYQYDNFVDKVGCTNATNGTLSCLRSLDTAILQINQGNIPFPGQTSSPLYMWTNVIDGDFTPDYTYKLFAEGKFVRIPTIYGAVTNDGTNFAPKNTSSVAEMTNFLTSNFPRLTRRMLHTIDSFYPEGPVYPGAQAYWPPTAQAYGEMRYRCPGLYMSSMQQQYGVPAWNYHYNVLTPTSISSGSGVTHTIETNAIWGPTSSSPSNYHANSSFVLAMQGYWTSFIRSKDPNMFRYPGTVEWENFGDAPGRSVEINNDNTTMEPLEMDLAGRCAYFAKIGAYIQQ